nr:hemagglutinin repeat-containing protein [Acinetobacter soli]
MGQQGTQLVAQNNVNIQAAQQTRTEESKNQSKGWNVGVAASYGPQGGAAGVTAGGNVGKGKSSGSETSYLTSQIGSKDSQTTIQSGNTTNIIGGQVQGKGVKVDAKELNIESLQNTANYNSTQQNIEGQVTVGFGGASASGSANKTNINANYASVQDQAGIYAGDDGYQINVKNNTDLKGAIITSNPLAETLNKNSLSTGTLTYTDLHNQTEYDAKGLGVSGGVNVKGGWDGSGKNKEGRPSNSVNKSVGFGLDSDKDSSVTKSGVNTQNITITESIAQQALTGKTVEQVKADIYTTTSTETAKENSGTIANNFDKDKVQREIGTQIAVTKRFDANRQEAGITVGNIIQTLQVTGQVIEGAKEAYAIANKIEQENQKLSSEDQLLFGNLIIELSKSKEVDSTDSYYPLIVAAGEAFAMAAGACAKSPACVSATVNALGAVGVAILSEQSDDKDKKSTPKPLPSTSGNSATGMPPNDEDKNNDKISSNSKIDKILKNAKSGRETKGRTDQFEKNGGFTQANKEFDSLGLQNVKDIPIGRVGQLKDGTKVVVRSRSSDGRPTLEIQSSPRKIEIRYNP